MHAEEPQLRLKGVPTDSIASAGPPRRACSTAGWMRMRQCGRRPSATECRRRRPARPHTRQSRRPQWPPAQPAPRARPARRAGAAAAARPPTRTRRRRAWRPASPTRGARRSTRDRASGRPRCAARLPRNACWSARVGACAGFGCWLSQPGLSVSRKSAQPRYACADVRLAVKSRHKYARSVTLGDAG